MVARKIVPILMFAVLFVSIGFLGKASAQFTYNEQVYKDIIPEDSADTIPLGTQINLQNWKQYQRFMPVGMRAFYSGQYSWKIGPEADYTITVGPTIHIPMPRQYVQDTEHYSSQVKLRQVDSGGYTIDGYVAGLPFPNPAEPLLPYKMAYNLRNRYTPFVTHYLTNSHTIDRFHSISLTKGDINGWRLSSISEPDMPKAMPYAAGVQITARFFDFQPEQVKYTTQIAQVFADPERVQEVYVFLPSLRRALRLSSAARCSPILGTDWVQDDNGDGSYLQWPNFKVEYLGEKKVLGMMHMDPVARFRSDSYHLEAASLPSWPKPVEGKWELRDVYLVQVSALPVMRGYCYGPKIFYVDKETWQPFWVDIYDVQNKLWKTDYSLVAPIPINQNESALVPGTFNEVMIDLQNDHMSTSEVYAELGANKFVAQKYWNAQVLGFPAGLAQIMQ